jgi:ABC-type antimicrobial peptide transport system permease subunit
MSAGALLHNAISAADPLLPVTPAISLTEAAARATAFQRLLLTLVGTCAFAALLLATIGIYGLMANSVQERTREMGIRMALGATASQVIGGVARVGMATAAAGILVGVGLAWLATRLIEAFLWGVDHHDPATFGAITVLLFMTAAAASVLPALRILWIDPARTLRV